MSEKQNFKVKPEHYQKSQISVDLPMTYLHFNSGGNKPLLVFFHGYSDSASSFLRRAFPDLDSRFEILAPNGLFPVPVKRDENWKPAYSWYFADYSKNEVVMPPQISAQAVQHLLERLGLREREKVLVGFSQGGFFLPFVLPHLQNVKKLFAIGAAYRKSDYPSPFHLTLDALHGDQDEIIPLETSKHSFAAFREINPRGEYFEFKGLGHTMDEASRAFLKKRIGEVF